jgi:hypothetical protein
MNFNSTTLLTDLKKTVNDHIDFSKQLLELSEEKLQWRVKENSWSVLECLVHLNLYAIFYNNKIEEKMDACKLSFSETFKSGYLGNKFANDMLPKEKLNKMKTFKSKNPIHSNLNKETVLLEFIKHQEKMLSLLETAATKNLKIKVQTTLPFVKFKLGDTFRFVINHNVRHIEQAKRVLDNQQK